MWGTIEEKHKEVAAELRRRLSAVVKSGKRARTRKRQSNKVRPLTERQVEVMQLVGEYKGNLAAVARQMGLNHKTVRQHYKAAMNKLGQKSLKHPTTRLPTDRRGQVNVADDRRR